MWEAPILSLESWLLIGTALVIIRYYIHRKWQILAKLNIQHDPPSIMNFGTMRGVFSEKMFTRDNEDKEKYGPIYGAYAGLSPIIICHDLDIMRQIYTKEFANFPDRQKALKKMNGKTMNHGLTVVTGNQWKRIRSTMSPTFSLSKLKQVMTLVDGCIDRTEALLKKQRDCNDGIFVPKTIFSNLSLDVIATSALGADCGCQSLDGKEGTLSGHMKNVFMYGFNSLTSFVCFICPPAEWVFEKFNISIFPYKDLEYLRKFTETVIEERSKMGKSRKDLLQLLLAAEVPEEKINEDATKGLTRVEVVGNAMLMIGAGYENTANTMTFLAYNVAFHPDVQKRLQEEIDDAFQEKGGFDYETVNNMKYLDMCLNESLRLYFPLIANARICKKTTTVNGLTIPKDTQMNFPIFALAHSTDYWDDPWEYNPERMADMSQIDPLTFQPFGAGPRNCIGLRFAQLEIKLTFCKLLHKFSIEPSVDTPKPPLKLAFGLSVRPKEEFKLKVVERTDR